VYDVRWRRIPNWLSALGILLGLILNGIVRGAAGLALGFGVYFLLYLVHATSAGDVKLMGAIGALAGWKQWLAIWLITALLGGIVAAAITLRHGRFKKTLWNVGYILSEFLHGRAAYRTREDLDVRNPAAMRLPHGAVIAAATVLYVLFNQ
jgi:prepilin peptidase CpaA